MEEMEARRKLATLPHPSDDVDSPGTNSKTAPQTSPKKKVKNPYAQKKQRTQSMGAMQEESKKSGSEEWDDIKREDVNSDDEAIEFPEPTSAEKQRSKSFPASMSSDNPDEDEFVMVS